MKSGREERRSSRSGFPPNSSVVQVSPSPPRRQVQGACCEHLNVTLSGGSRTRLLRRLDSAAVLLLHGIRIQDEIESLVGFRLGVYTRSVKDVFALTTALHDEPHVVSAWYSPYPPPLPHPPFSHYRPFTMSRTITFKTLDQKVRTQLLRPSKTRMKKGMSKLTSPLPSFPSSLSLSPSTFRTRTP